MKRVVIFLLLALGWLDVSGQTGPVCPYNHPSKETLHALALEETSKGSSYRTYIVQVINVGLKDTTLRVSDSYINFIFQHLHLEEVELKEGYYLNSGWNPSLGKMIPSVGHGLGWGFQWVFRIGTYSIVLIKEDCGNILVVPVIRKITQNNTALQPYIKNIDRRPVRDDWRNGGSVVVIINNEIQPAPLPVNVYVPKKKQISFWGIALPTAGLIAIIYAIIKLLLNNNQAIIPPVEPRGPGGAPVTPPVTPPDGGDTGGPGGSPTTR